MKKPAALSVAALEYRKFITDLKDRVLSARISAARAVNRDLILLYWDIGWAIVEKQRVLGWGEAVIDQVSTDLQEAFPATTGFSPRNLRSMKPFYLAYSDPAIWLQAVARFDRGAKDAEIWRQPAAKLILSEVEVVDGGGGRLPQRGCVRQPRVAVWPLPWAAIMRVINPNGVASEEESHYAAIAIIRSYS